MNINTLQLSLNNGFTSAAHTGCAVALVAKKIVCEAPRLIGQTAKELVLATPGIMADILGPQILGGAQYDWAARPLVVGAHSFFRLKHNRQNALFNAFSLPLGRAIVAVPQISQAIDAVSNVSSKLSDCVTDKIPEETLSKQTVQIFKNFTKGQFIGYLQALVVYKLASAFFKVDRPEPSIMSVISPMNLIWVGFAASLMRLMAYLQSLDSEIELPRPLPSESAPPKKATPLVTKSLPKSESTSLQPTKALAPPLPKKSWKERCFRIKTKTAVQA